MVQEHIRLCIMIIRTVLSILIEFQVIITSNKGGDTIGKDEKEKPRFFIN